MSGRRLSTPRVGGIFGARRAIVVAIVVVGAGLLTIGLGWYGASGTGGQIGNRTDLRAQLPYLLSGGFLGLALVTLGTGLLVVHALKTTRDRLEEMLYVAVERAERGTPEEEEALRGLVVAGAASYHDPVCRLVNVDAGTRFLTPAEAAADGLVACRLCTPPAPPATLGDDAEILQG